MFGHSSRWCSDGLYKMGWKGGEDGYAGIAILWAGCWVWVCEGVACRCPACVSHPRRKSVVPPTMVFAKACVIVVIAAAAAVFALNRLERRLVFHL